VLCLGKCTEVATEIYVTPQHQSYTLSDVVVTPGILYIDQFLQYMHVCFVGILMYMWFIFAVYNVHGIFSISKCCIQ
jgi:hypothetical protein